jgi:hypothetical protein
MTTDDRDFREAYIHANSPGYPDGKITDQRAAPPAEGWCHTCGNPVTLENICCCWGHVADTLQRFLGMDFDGAAQDAADMWREMSDEEKEFVWSGRHADTHQVDTYPPPPALAALIAQDHLDHPDDEDCPRCARRQWAEDDPEAGPFTCRACGWTTMLEAA